VKRSMELRGRYSATVPVPVDGADGAVKELVCNLGRILEAMLARIAI
jgi:hypothetical protein